MDSFETHIQNAVRAAEVPGAVAVGSDAKGTSYYAKAFGFHSLKEGDKKPMKLDTIFYMASCTKLMASIAALQCVERGQFTLDEDVTRLLPELKNIDILTGFEEGTEKPILVKAKKTITLRHFLTHTSGLPYDVFNPVMTRWRISQGEVATFTGRTLLERYTTPLLFEPGESFEYSPGLDWAGQMVERANNMSLGEYMQKFIWSPLGIKDISFHLDQRPDMLARLADMTERQGGMTMFGTPADEKGALAWTADKVWVAEGMPDDSGGAGSYASIVEYQKILQSLTVNDGKLLSSEMLDEMFRPQLPEPAQKTFEMALTIKEVRYIQAGSIPAGTKVGHGLAGVVILQDLDGGRRKGRLSWGGLPNLFWWIDRVAGVNGIYGSQVIPTGDPRSIEVFAEFEKALYKSVEGKK